jgi:hypothetical protein
MRTQVGLIGLALAGIAAAGFAVAGPSKQAVAPTTAAAPDFRPPPLTRALTAEPLAFEPNTGQVAPEVAYVARAGRRAVEVRPTGATLTVTDVASRTVALELVGADPTARMSTAEKVPGPSSAFAKVVAEQALPGIDLAWHDSAGELGYALRVVPGAEVDEIRMAVGNARQLVVDESGALLIETPHGTFTSDVPVAYQEIDGQRHEVPSRYVVDGEHFGFAVGDHDPTRPLFIDPVVRYAP